MRHFTENREKLKELILYVSEKCGDDPRYGATKLNKILFFSDFFAYAKYGEPITGAEYMRESYGPIPKRLLPARQELVSEGALAIQESQVSHTATQKRPVSLRAANLALFTGQQIALVDWVIEQLRGANASSVSKHTHKYAMWQAASNGETIPYETVFVSEAPLSSIEIERGRELATEHGWLLPTEP
jgi:hypothetical protein